MKKLVSLLIIALVAGSLFTVSAQNRKLDFTLENRTGSTIMELYVSAASTNDWEEDILGVDVLADGESVTITFSRNEKAVLFDIKILDEDADTFEWFEIPLNEVNVLTLSFNKRGEAVASWK